jgi:polyhydroxyalkanoate synthesis repressor PhaR
MTEGPIQIKRYPNRRYYARNTSKYVSLSDIGEMVRQGDTVEIRDSQSNQDMTQSVLTQIIMDRHPEKLSLFPPDLLHFILRSDDLMSNFLGEYFRQSLSYLDRLRGHHPAATAMLPMTWVKSWLDRFSPAPTEEKRSPPTDESALLAERLKQLEERLAQLESDQD